MSTGDCLVFGAGLVSPPLLEYLCSLGHHVIVATIDPTDIQDNIEKIQGGSATTSTIEVVACNVQTETGLVLAEELIKCAKIVCSILPATLHIPLAKIALKHNTHFATASYVSPEMKALDVAFREAGIISLNECGVDPGLDHMSVKRAIDRIHAAGGKVHSLVSLCGGLPAPLSNNNVMGYKLSWSPQSVLLATLHDARFLEKGVKVHKNTPVLQPHRRTVESVGEFEWYENRDSLKYAETYGIPECKTLIRGTFRNVGFHKLMRAVMMMGFLDTKEHPDLGGQTYKELHAKCVVEAQGEGTEYSSAEPWVHIALSEIGLFSETEHVPRGTKTTLDAFCHLFKKSCQYRRGEKDMILMQHLLEVERADGSMQRLCISLVNYGLQPDGCSAMARTVSLPLAVAMDMILKGSLHACGVVCPLTPDIYEPILEKMAEFGIVFEEEDEICEPEQFISLA